MRFKEALVGIFTALVSAIASVFVVNRALEDKKSHAPGGKAGPPSRVRAQGESQTQAQALPPQTEARNPAGFFPKRQEELRQEQARKEAEKATAMQHEFDRKPVPPGWAKPEPQHIPRPTYWPVTVSVGITFIFWGVATSLIVTLIGLIVFFIGMVGWIGEMRNDAHD